MRRSEFGYRLACMLTLLTLALHAAGQDTPKLSDEKRASLIAERDALANQAIAQANQGDFGGAQKLFDQVLDIETSIFGEAHEELLGTLDYKTQVANAAQDWNAAIDYRRRAYQIGKLVYSQEGYQLRDLERAIKEASDNMTRTEGERHKLQRADALDRQVVLLYQQGKPADAINLAKQIIELREMVLGEEHPDVAASLNNLAGLYRTMGDYARSEPLFVEAKAIDEKVLGKEHPEYATCLINLAGLYRSMGEPARAEPLLVEARTIQETVLGKHHPDYAASLNDLAALYKSLGEYARAEAHYIQAKSIRATVLGKTHPDYATSLNGLAGLYELMGDYTRAEPLYVEAKEIYQEVLGKEHPNYATSLHNLGGLFVSMGDYARAEPLYAEAKAVWEKAVGSEHPDYAASLHSLAFLYAAMGDYARAEPLYVETKTIMEKAVGRQHPNYATCLDNLAILLKSMGDFARAEPFLVEAKNIREKVLGKEHPDYAASLNNMAFLYLGKGDYARAEPLFVEAKNIREMMLGKEHLDYAVSLNNLAYLYGAMGDYSRAEQLYAESKTVTEKAVGTEHRAYAMCLNNLAMLYDLTGDDARAEPLYVEAKNIAERVLGKEHPDYAASLSNLAGIYGAAGDFARAELLHIEAKTIAEKTFGPEHPDYASSLNNLGSLYKSMGDYARAEPQYLEAKTIWEETLGKEHTNYTTCLNNLAGLYESMRDYGRAEPLYQDAVRLTLRHLQKTAFVQSEQQQMLMSQAFRFRLDNYLECCVQGDLNPRNAIEQLVLWKGSTLRRARTLRLAASDPAIADLFRQLQSTSSQLSSSLRSIPTPQQMGGWKSRIASLSEKKRELEVELMGQSVVFRDAVKPIRFDQIRRSIPADGVLIDYLEYSGAQGRSLLASVIRRDGDLVLLDLGSASSVGQAVDTWRKSFGVTSDAKTAGAWLRRQLWEPLLDHITKDELILLSTDGVLGRLPFGSLPGEKPNTYLIEDHRIALVPVPQLLPSLVGKQESQRPERILLVGDVDYGSPKSANAWPSLPETRLEVDFVKELFTQTSQANQDSIKDLRAGQASESAFRAAAPKCQLLHLATHGFFAAADRKNALSASLIADSRGSSPMQFSSMSGPEREMVAGYSPGQLSGLVFAGANLTGRTINKFSDGKPVEDGIMTAEEIAYLPLDKTKLAVLSACETGLGEVAGGEGLIGIQRAFQIAGANSVVATMWKVDDVVTRKLMERFYQNLFVEKMSKLDALREAQLWVLRNPSMVDESADRGAVRERKQRIAVTRSDSGPRTNPYYWAPFVLSGDWR